MISSENKKVDSVKQFCLENQIPFKENVEIKYETYFKKGGMVRAFIQPNSQEKLLELVIFLVTVQQKFKIIGFTSNILMLDSHEYDVIVSTKYLTEVTELENNTIEFSAGFSIEQLSRVALLKSVTGFEGLEGIPGTIGGGILMNAGAYGYQISDKIVSVKAINEKGQVVILSKDDCQFDFRTSFFKKHPNYTVVSALFNFNSFAVQNNIASKMEVFHIARHSYQEFTYPNLGSMYSTRQDMYKEILSQSLTQKVIYWALKLTLKNPIMKFLNRKKPTNKKFNDIVLLYHKFSYPISHKSINILINDGKVSDKDIIKHIEKLGALYHDSTHLENEIYLGKARNASVR